MKRTQELTVGNKVNTRSPWSKQDVAIDVEVVQVIDPDCAAIGRDKGGNELLLWVDHASGEIFHEES